MSRDLIEPMEFFKVDKISDDVYAIAPNIILKFNVSLSKVSNGKRYHYHKEYEYPTSNREFPSLVTIKRSFDYYLSIENQQKDSGGNKLFIRIGPQEYFMIKNGLERVISWFNSSEYRNLFVTDKGKLIMTAPIPSHRIEPLPMQKYIEFTPTIIDKGIANADKSPGIMVEFGDPSNRVNITLDKLMGLYYIISCFNMYQAALSIVNYLERPEFGTNRFVMEMQKTVPQDTTIYGASGVQDRFVTPKGSKNNISLLEG